MRIAIIALVAMCAAAGGCSKGLPKPGAPHPRIVSCSPALTEIAVSLGLGDQIVGVDQYSRKPAGPDVPVVCSAAGPNAEAVASTEPDLLLIQTQPETYDAVRKLCPRARIEHFKIETVSDVAAALERVGTLAGQAEKGTAARKQFQARLDAVRGASAKLAKPRVLFLMGFEHPSTGAAGTFTNDLIELTGGVNAAGGEGWVTLSAEHLLKAAPDVLVCLVDPGQEDQARKAFAALTDLPAVRDGRVFIVTDNRWFVPSPDLPTYAQRLLELIHPEARSAASNPAIVSGGCVVPPVVVSGGCGNRPVSGPATNETRP